MTNRICVRLGLITTGLILALLLLPRLALVWRAWSWSFGVLWEFEIRLSDFMPAWVSWC